MRRSARDHAGARLEDHYAALARDERRRLEAAEAEVARASGDLAAVDARLEGARERLAEHRDRAARLFASLLDAESGKRR